MSPEQNLIYGAVINAMNQSLCQLNEDRGALEFSRLSSEDLAFHAQQGDRCAFLELVDRNYQGCFRLALRILRNHQDAEDQVQNAFLRALQHLDQFRYRAKFSSWLGQIVINQCNMRFRELQRTRNVGTAEDCCHATIGPISDAAPNPEQALLERDRWDAAQAEIQRLPSLYREPLVLRYLSNLSLADVADRLGVSVPTVKSRLFRGQVELRRRLLAHAGSKMKRRATAKAP